MLNTAGRVLSGYKRLAMGSPYLSGVLKGAGGLGLIAALWAGQSDLFGRSYKVDENDKLIPIDAKDISGITEDDLFDTYEMYSNMADILNNQKVTNEHDVEVLNETKKWSQNITNKVEDEQTELFRLTALLKEYTNSRKEISKNEYKQFITSKEFDDTDMVTKTANEIISNFNKPNYESLTREQKYELLSYILKLRFSRLSFINKNVDNIEKIQILKNLHDSGKLKITPEYIKNLKFNVSLKTDDTIKNPQLNIPSVIQFPEQMLSVPEENQESKKMNFDFGLDGLQSKTNMSDILDQLQNGISYNTDEGKELADYLSKQGIKPTSVTYGNNGVSVSYNSQSAQVRHAVTDFMVNKSIERKQATFDKDIAHAFSQTFSQVSHNSDEILSQSHEEDIKIIEQIIPNYSKQSFQENIKQLNEKIDNSKFDSDKLKEIKERITELINANHILMVSEKHKKSTELKGDAK